jgi:hypothetical protein
MPDAPPDSLNYGIKPARVLPLPASFRPAASWLLACQANAPALPLAIIPPLMPMIDLYTLCGEQARICRCTAWQS